MDTGEVGAEPPGGRRLRETREFFAFTRGEIPQMLERWREHKRTVFADGAVFADVADGAEGAG